MFEYITRIPLPCIPRTLPHQARETAMKVLPMRSWSFSCEKSGRDAAFLSIGWSYLRINFSTIHRKRPLTRSDTSGEPAGCAQKTGIAVARAHELNAERQFVRAL